MGRIRRWTIVTVVGLAALGAVPAASAAPTTYTWTGQGLSGAPDWSNAANWDSNGVPTSDIDNATLAFPGLHSNHACTRRRPTEACYTSVDDLNEPLSVNQLQIADAHGYSIDPGSGSPSLMIGSGGIVDTPNSSGPGTNLSVPVVLGASQTWTFNSSEIVSADLAFVGNLTLNSLSTTSDSDTLSLIAPDANDQMPTEPSVNLDGGAEIGPLTIDGVYLAFGSQGAGDDLNGADAEPVNVTNGAMLNVANTGSTVGPLTVSGTADMYSSLQVGLRTAAATLAVSGDASFDDDSFLDFDITQNGATPGDDFSQLTASGNIALGGSHLDLEQPYVEDGQNETCENLAAGDVATIVSDPTGTISGTFAGLPDGSTTWLPNCPYVDAIQATIHYTPHAVTVTTTQDETSMALQISPASPSTNQPLTLTATVTGASLTPTGDVEFTPPFVPPIAGCESVPLVASATANTATATCSTTWAASSSEGIWAVYYPTSNSVGSITATQLTVIKGATATALAASSTAPSTGASVTYTATVTPATTGAVSPTGPVEFLDGTTPINGCAAQTVSSAGTATCTTSYSIVGSHSITAVYAGDGNFTTSTSPAQVVQVVAAPVVTSGGTGAPSLPTAPGCTPSVGRVKTERSSAAIPVSAAPGGASCTVTVQLTATERVRGSKVLSVSATHGRVKTNVIVLGSATVTIAAGQTRQVKVSLSAKGRRLVARHHRLKLALEVTLKVDGRTKTVAAKSVAFKATKNKH